MRSNLCPHHHKAARSVADVLAQAAGFQMGVPRCVNKDIGSQRGHWAPSCCCSAPLREMPAPMKPTLNHQEHSTKALRKQQHQLDSKPLREHGIAKANQHDRHGPRQSGAAFHDGMRFTRQKHGTILYLQLLVRVKKRFPHCFYTP